MLLEDGDVLVVDNLSTGAHGLEENSNDDFDRLVGWLLSLRRRRITVIIVHHAGKSGAMRGASRREDMAHWIIGLKDETQDGEELAIQSRFRKLRNGSSADAPPMRWTLAFLSGECEVGCKPFRGPEALLDLIKAGLDSATKLAEEMEVSKGTVSKWATKLEERGLILKKERKYVLI